MRPPLARAPTARKAISYQSERDIKAGDQPACFSRGCKGITVFKWAGMPALTGERGVTKRIQGREEGGFSEFMKKTWCFVNPLTRLISTVRLLSVHILSPRVLARRVFF
jgi:hypothetical protein